MCYTFSELLMIESTKAFEVYCDKIVAKIFGVKGVIS